MPKDNDDRSLLHSIQSESSDLSIASHIIQYILSDGNGNASTPAKDIGTISTAEKQRAMELLEGACLLCESSKMDVLESNGLPCLFQYIGAPLTPITLQFAAIDTLIACLVDSPAFQSVRDLQLTYDCVACPTSLSLMHSILSTLNYG